LNFHESWFLDAKTDSLKLDVVDIIATFRWDYIRDGPNLVRNMDRLDAFYKGLTTWANWVDANVDPTKTKLFFQGISPTHYQ
jgi:hypothetical protein